MSDQVFISGYTTVKNATKLYFPIKASILSILPIVDEFVVALGDCDEDDSTEEEIRSINSDKIRIIHTTWDTDKYKHGTVLASQTDIAMKACTGKWLFYLQADEVIHEDYHAAIVNRCKELDNDQQIDGLLFNYVHFWGDYDHHQISHGWYPREIRITRNDPQIHSWGDAQSFRRIPNFDHKDYRQETRTAKLQVATVDASVYHYGWVRPPSFMQNKRKSMDSNYHDTKKVNEMYAGQKNEFDYGPLKLAKEFKGTHPAVMKTWIEDFNWADKLYQDGPIPNNRRLFKHEKLKYRLITVIEQGLLKGKSLGGFNNYQLMKR